MPEELTFNSIVLSDLTLSVRRPFKLSTLSVRTEYIYSAASQATSPGGVYILRDFHTLVKKKSIGAMGFRFVPLDPSMFIDSVALFATFKASSSVC